MSLFGIWSVGYSIQIRTRRSYRRAWHRGLLLHSRTQSTNERSNNNMYPSEVPSKHLPRLVSGVQPNVLPRKYKIMFNSDKTNLLPISDDRMVMMCLREITRKVRAGGYVHLQLKLYKFLIMCFVDNFYLEVRASQNV